MNGLSWMNEVLGTCLKHDSSEATVSPSVTLLALLWLSYPLQTSVLTATLETPYPHVKCQQTSIKQRTCSFVVHAIQPCHFTTLTGMVLHFFHGFGLDKILPVESKLLIQPWVPLYQFSFVAEALEQTCFFLLFIWLGPSQPFSPHLDTGWSGRPPLILCNLDWIPFPSAAIALCTYSYHSTHCP